jgi:hypothetical protein
MLIEGISADDLKDRAIATLIEANTDAFDRVSGPKDWPTRPELFPAMVVSVPRERKVSLGRGVPQFNTTITLVVIARDVDVTEEPVARRLLILKEQIENALICTTSFILPIQQFSMIDTQSVVTAEGKQHIGEIGMTFEIEIYQVYEPNDAVPLVDIRGTITNGAGGGTLATIDVSFAP